MPVENKSTITLIVGSNSLIGGALMTYLQRVGVRVVGTTRRLDDVDDCHIYLDLSKDVEGWRCLYPITVAVVCAGVTKIEACRRDPMATARVNVQGVSALVKNLVASGTFVLYLSSNQVFDGTVPYRLPDAPVSPVTEYGRQKAEAEGQLLTLGDLISVVRFTKVIEPNMPLFKGWIQALKNNEAIHPFSDMVMAPVALPFAVEVLYRVAEARLPGIVQVSGERDVTYEQVAHRIAQSIGASPDLVQPVTSKDAGLDLEAVPSHTTLDTARLRTELRMESPDVWSTIDSLLEL